MLCHMLKSTSSHNTPSSLPLGVSNHAGRLKVHKSNIITDLQTTQEQSTRTSSKDVRESQTKRNPLSQPLPLDKATHRCAIWNRLALDWKVRGIKGQVWWDHNTKPGAGAVAKQRPLNSCGAPEHTWTHIHTHQQNDKQNNKAE